ncbi:hypothetical protein BDN72DRAFT_114850 [Pluteus cervinus]|uniref:Uncharacterized protein n=1 Tax=Pluteus cervinus TaxID=181527 RepID=A0ACD3AQC0_9AGAR|nr:hypothetical protein BDN72DRAFT_114850 [Pluteus cervinus]
MAKKKSIRKRLEASNVWNQMFRIPLNHHGSRASKNSQSTLPKHDVQSSAQPVPRNHPPPKAAVTQQSSKSQPSIQIRLKQPSMPDYPVAQTIPEDILFIIFSLLGLTAATKVSHICRHWRAAALNHNTFWCTFRPGLSKLHSLAAYISRARVGPIDLYVDQNLVDEPPTLIFDIINSKAPRIRTLFLHGRQFPVLFPQLIPFLPRLPELECLALTATDAVRDWITQPWKFESLAQLQNVKFLQLESSFIAHAVEYLPPSLTTLSLQAGDINNNRFRWVTEDQLKLIITHPTLENLSLCGSLFSSAGDHTFIRIAAPNLGTSRIKSLRYHGDYHVFANFYARMTFSQLETLTLAGLNICQLSSAFARAFRTIESIELIRCTVTGRSNDFMSWLSMLKKLRHLTLVGEGSIDGFRVGYSKDGFSPRPELETLSCPSVMDNVAIEKLYCLLKWGGPKLLMNPESLGFIGESEEELKAANVGVTTYAWPPGIVHDPNEFDWKYTRFESKYKF